MDEDSARSDVHDWGRTARLAGWIAAGGLLLQTLLFVADSAEIVADSPVFRESGAGPQTDLATFYVAFFERQHDILWNIAIRDTVGPVASLALIVLAWAFVRVRGRGRPRVEVWASVLAVGALLRVLSDVVYLSQLAVWRLTGFRAEPPADIIASGRAAERVTDLADYLEYTALVTVAVAVVGLASVLAPRLRVLALVLAAGLILAVVSALASWDGVYQVTALLTGAVLAPSFLVALGHSLAGPTDPRAPAAPGAPAVDRPPGTA